MAYVSGCEDILTSYNCDKCPTVEKGKIRHFALVHKSYYDTLIADPTTLATWEAGVNADFHIILIPDVHGELPEPSEIVLPGYGDTLEELAAFDFILNVFDRRYIENCEFYNLIKANPNYHVAYFTQTLGHISTMTSAVKPRPSIQDDQGTIVEMKTVAAWRDLNHPCPFVYPSGLFTDCFIPD